MSGFADPIVGGVGTLIREFIQSPNYVPNVSGWTINKDGSAEFQSLIVGPGTSVRTFMQDTTPVATNIGDLWINTSQGGTINRWDGTQWVLNQFGAGSISADAINALSIISMAISAGSITGTIGTSNIINSSLNDCDIVIDDSGGTILIYGVTGQIVNTISAGGAGVFNVPAGVTAMKVECWGGGGGGAGGGAFSGFGGPSGAGGEYACEPIYPVAPLAALNYSVGSGGVAGTVPAGNGGPGNPTTFDTAVIAHGGGGSFGGWIAGGASGSTNAIHFNGGNNAVTAWGTANSSSGGSSAGTSHAGTPGNPGTASGRGPTAIAPTGGGNGGTSSTNGPGGVGIAPGGGGGGGAGNAGGKVGGAGAGGRIRLTYGGARVLLLSIAGVAGTDAYGNTYPAGIRVGHGPGATSGYYHEEWTQANTSTPNNVLTTMVGLTLNPASSFNDYTTAMVTGTGIWTAPVDGIYTFSCRAVMQGMAIGNRGIIRISNNVTGEKLGQFDVQCASTIWENTCTSGPRFIPAGTTVKVEVFQNSGAPQLIGGRIVINKTAL